MLVALYNSENAQDLAYLQPRFDITNFEHNHYMKFDEIRLIPALGS